jgi:hypothetical protein
VEKKKKSAGKKAREKKSAGKKKVRGLLPGYGGRSPQDLG